MTRKALTYESPLEVMGCSSLDLNQNGLWR
jgi:hypothetical protein